MARSIDKYEQKQRALIERTAAALRIDTVEARRLLNTKRVQSVRLNTLKDSLQSLETRFAALAPKTQRVPWMPEGFFLSDTHEAIRDSAMNEAGEVYIQNAASWLPVMILEPSPGEHVLDVCAAPGGKTSHIAQRSANQAFITANDNSRPRLHKMQHNLERLNAQNITFSLRDASQLSRHLEPESFDKILLDAPCSGEGMMQLDRPKDFESWSVAHIKRLQSLQKRLIVQAWKLLKPGGTLVYSTCTMAPEENEAVVDYLLKHNEDAHLQPLTDWQERLENSVAPVKEWNNRMYSDELQGTLRLAPSPQVEAFFVAKLTKQPSDF